ncbi:MAG: hypothetical protein IIA60_12110 [Candidatus Marinimicrobia bacterium]|nr:hypothetical protein [Candidatus Neomarinimicrobiota bacterium]
MSPAGEAPGSVDNGGLELVVLVKRFDGSTAILMYCKRVTLPEIRHWLRSARG